MTGNKSLTYLILGLLLLDFAGDFKCVDEEVAPGVMNRLQLIMKCNVFYFVINVLINKLLVTFDMKCSWGP